MIGSVLKCNLALTVPLHVIRSTREEKLTSFQMTLPEAERIVASP